MTVFKVFGRFTVCLIKNLQLMYLLELQAGHSNSIKTISLKSALDSSLTGNSRETNII